MKDIRLKELTLSNWKGQTRKVSFGDNENMIYGFNASGKTSLMRAWNWILTGYCDCNSPMNADLFNNKEEITKDTPIASVKAVVSIDGEIYTIERSAEAKFQRKRGTESWEKASSDSYVYKVDEIERSANDFRDWLSEKFTDIDMLRFAVDGSYFVASICEDKKKSRQIIERLVGNVTREEMRGNYECIDELLQRFSLDEIEMRAANLAKGINQRLNEIPSLIQSKETEIAEIEQTDFEGNEKEIAKLEQERDNLDKRMTDLSERVRPQMDAKYKAERDKQMKQDVFDKAYSEWTHSFDARKQQLNTEINAIRQQNEKSQQAHDKTLKDIENAQTQKRFKTKELEVETNKHLALLKERDDEKNRVFDASTAICPYCGHQLDGDKLQEEVNKFEAKRRQTIDEIVVKGKAAAENIKRLEEEIRTLDATIKTPAPKVINQSTEDLEKQLLDLSAADISKEAFDATEQGKTLLADIEAVVIPEVVMPDNSEIVAAKKEVNDKLAPLYERRGLKSRLQSLKEGVEVLRIEQKEKGSELAKYERQRQLVKNYKQEQMEILGHKVNDGLKFSTIECWSQQKDGQVVPDLVIKDAKGVNFATTNGASRGLTVVDVQRFFCDKLGINMPTFLDEASIFSEGNLPKLEGVQTFYLFCANTGLTIESK